MIMMEHGSHDHLSLNFPIYFVYMIKYEVKQQSYLSGQDFLSIYMYQDSWTLLKIKVLKDKLFLN